MSQQQTQKRSYKATLNLPRTTFAMKANLVQNEPAAQKRWNDSNLYGQIREAPHPKGPFVFHDGPPYANGSIHLGHLLNKVLKDFVVRSKTMRGYDCPFVPGWDCHGLPIEHMVLQSGEGGKSEEATDRRSGEGGGANDRERMAIRRRCRRYAEKYVKIQKAQMLRLLTLADYDHPYLTMDPAYEAAVLEVFADLVEKGLVYRGLKPVHWSIENCTALADAELEYYDREDRSIYVLFEVEDPSSLKIRSGQKIYLMIWTTTPWTLPANLAVAVHKRFEYGLYQVDGKALIVAKDLAPKVLAFDGTKAPDPLATFTGEQLLGLCYCHPFVEDDRKRPVVAADYVTLDDGTGLVHTAPGHGVEDYQTGLQEGFDIYCPVREDGTFDDTVPQWLKGASVWAANDLIVQSLRGSGHLFHEHTFIHSYPHDWRGKTPVIFRATEQWFISVDQRFDGGLLDTASVRGEAEGEDLLQRGPAHQHPHSVRLGSPQASPCPDQERARSLRDRAMHVTTKEVEFFPVWGRNRMRGMLESRPDWCLSRQRAWGLPIPAFYNEDGQPLLTAASVRAVAQVLGEQGSDVWFLSRPDELLKHYDPGADADAPDWIRRGTADPLPPLRKSTDIFDVWFESGSSWHAAVRLRGLGRHGAGPVADLYLEGSDQHRGWFQLSLLPSLGVTGRAPFKEVLTHGFMVDKDGRKMSKSLGNTLGVDDLMKNFGADVCRWWVSSLNPDNDIKVDREFFKLAGEEYRKVRNTIRFLLSNLGDFDATRDRYTFGDADATSLDAWALSQLAKLTSVVAVAYDQYQFRKAHEASFNFCNETMSSIYLAATKDRLYCDRSSNPRRRRIQTALYHIADALIRLLAPVLPHTAEEAWRALNGTQDRSVHLEQFPQPLEVSVDPDWPRVMTEREGWMRLIEAARQESGIDNPLDCGLGVPRSDWLARFDPVDLADVCGISRFELVDLDAPRVMDLRQDPRCERSWKRDGTVSQRRDGGMLSDRDAEALGLA